MKSLACRKWDLKVVVEEIVSHHKEIEEIFPFEDGNSRVGRLIM